ncbi:hypothetical protein TNCT_600391 [Trichonephila clavata]|uniref:Uncharacterized protein n=1 Tax=Trichonephila clavata TaxID=2740835 RepID=A0A8X6JHC0_TRICU|nr:hypothetical protein TNCT_659591 [Trichonephila clavata]GFR06561.1 hypothetical protein TNCT_600391 [Trichonephila clavata]
MEPLGKPIKFFSVRSTFIKSLINIEENYNSTDNSTMFHTFEEELKAKEEQRKYLTIKIVFLSLCLVLLRIHNFSSKNLKKRLSEPIIKPAKLTVANKNADEDGFPLLSKSV